MKAKRSIGVFQARDEEDVFGMDSCGKQKEVSLIDFNVVMTLRIFQVNLFALLWPPRLGWGKK